MLKVLYSVRAHQPYERCWLKSGNVIQFCLVDRVAIPIAVRSKEQRYLKRSVSSVFAAACQIDFQQTHHASACKKQFLKYKEMKVGSTHTLMGILLLTGMLAQKQPSSKEWDWTWRTGNSYGHNSNKPYILFYRYGDNRELRFTG